MLFKKLIVSLTIVFSLLCSINYVFALGVYVGGESIGIVLDYPGVLITGGYEIKIDNKLYNPLDEDFISGDIILSIEGNKVNSISDMTNYLKTNFKDSYSIVINRNKESINKTLKVNHDNNDFNTGLYVKDSLSGAGTITYYSPESNTFGSLGHAMSDTYDNLEQTGIIYKSTVTSITRSSSDKVGKKNVRISDVKLGIINANNTFGIYGNYDTVINDKELIETADKKEIKLGSAYFYTVIDGQNISKVDINIISLDVQDYPDEKGIVFELVDSNIIKKTNGIIQGMSGSPIIQDDKLIGCVTHASSSNNLVGYGLYIDWMIENTQ